jgi:DNA-binding NarL/FixJ family response regulator
MLNTLIVEDNAAYRQSLHRLLEERFPSMRIAEAADGEEALRHAFSRRFDLIFMDIRLPKGNGFNLTETIKTVLDDTVICVLTSHDISEYRDAALLSGADHFMVKGESTEAEIVGLVESLLRSRFVTLLIVSDTLSRKQINMLLSIRWPAMFVAEAMDAATGLGHAEELKPNLVLLELRLPCASVVELVRDIRAGSPQAKLIGLTDVALPACQTTPINGGVDHCVPLTPVGHTELMVIVNSMRPERHITDPLPAYRASPASTHRPVI